MTVTVSFGELATPCAYYLSCKGATTSAAGKPKEEEEDIDLFGDETEEDKAALKKLTNGKKTEKKKKDEKNKSMLVIEIKPNSSETNLDDIEKEVQCVILDDLVNTQTITDKIEEIGMTEEDKKKREELMEGGGDEDEDEEMSGLVQSAEIVSFNKL
ncbi:hypothetical protein Emag_003183 [Eimeria magna]